MQDINWLSEIFLSTEMWGWFGPLILISVAFLVTANRKTRPLGIFFIIVESLVTYTYLTLVEATPWYWWNIIIMVLGLLVCIGQLGSR